MKKSSLINGTSKNQWPDPFQFSNYIRSNRIKQFSNLANKNQSILSTRDQSSNRSTTPTDLRQNSEKRTLHDESKKKDASFDIDNVKKKFDIIFHKLPKIPETFINSHKKKKKTHDNSILQDNTEALSRVLKAYSPNRSKSSLNTKNNRLPKIRNKNSDVSDLQKYLAEFHQKSKLLLNQLEQKVLGKKNTNEEC